MCSTFTSAAGGAKRTMEKLEKLSTALSSPQSGRHLWPKYLGCRSGDDGVSTAEDYRPAILEHS
jgi:hypothetical protein